MAQQTEFISYEEALAIKELGFDEPTSFYWEDNVIRPLPMKDEVCAFHFNRHTGTENEWICAKLYQQAFRWFREKYGFYVRIQPSINDDFSCVLWCLKFQNHIGIFKTYEEAELACLKKLIEIVKNK